VLARVLEGDAGDADSQHSLGQDIMPKLLRRGRCYVYLHRGYWNYVADVRDYWEANMELLQPHPRLNPVEWGVVSNPDDRDVEDRPPAFIGRTARISRSFIAEGTRVFGRVRNSIIFPGVFIGPEAVVEESIVMHDCRIGRGARLARAILDKDVVVGDSVMIGAHGPDVGHPGGDGMGPPITVVGKRVSLPQGVRVAAGAVLDAEAGGSPAARFAARRDRSAEGRGE